MEKLIDVNAYPIIDVLPILLKDKSTKQNIIWATDACTYRGTGYNDTDQMLENQITGIYALQLHPRISKSLEEQQDRTRKKAEVMTPVWLCNKMNNFADEQWFGRKDVLIMKMRIIACTEVGFLWHSRCYFGRCKCWHFLSPRQKTQRKVQW